MPLSCLELSQWVTWLDVSGHISEPTPWGGMARWPPLPSPCTGRRGDLALRQDCVQRLCSSARGLHGDRSGCPEDSRARAGHQELESRATSLLLGLEFEEGPGLWGPWEACNQGPRAAGREQPGSDRPGPQRTRGVPKRVYELPGPALGGSEQGVLPTREGAREGSPPAREQWAHSRAGQSVGGLLLGVDADFRCLNVQPQASLKTM